MIKLILVAFAVTSIVLCHNDANKFDFDDWDIPRELIQNKCDDGEGLLTTGGECVPCPPGTFNFRESYTDTCLLCPRGTYTDKPGADECYHCEWDLYDGAYTTEGLGSDKQSDCKRKSEYLDNKSGVSELNLLINVEGPILCEDGVKNLLLGISQVAPFDGQLEECSYTDGVNQIALKATVPTRYAIESVQALSHVESYIPVIRAFQQFGDHFIPKVFSYVNNELEGILGLHLYYEMLNLMDFKLLKFEASFDYVSLAGDPTSGSATQAEFIQYFSYDLVGVGTDLPYHMVDCEDNTVRSYARSFIESNEAGLPSANDVSYTFVDCKNVGDNIRLVFLVKFTAESEGQVSNFPDSISVEIMEQQVSLEKSSFALSDESNYCSSNEGYDGTGFEDGSDEFNVGECVSCPAGYFANDDGRCTRCPTTTYGDTTAPNQCLNCPYFSETPFWGMEGADSCLETDNWNNDGWLRDPAGEIGFLMHINPGLNMCPIQTAKVELDRVCENVFGKLTIATFNDFDIIQELEERKLQGLICLLSANAPVAYDNFCDEYLDSSWEDVRDNLMNEGDILGAICYVGKRLRDLDGQDISEDCGNLDESLYKMEMPIEFQASLGIVGGSGILVDLFTGFKNLEGMNFGLFSDAGEHMMEVLGISDLNTFTGWELADALKDLAFSMPRAFRMIEFNFTPSYNEDDFFCDNGEIRRSCYGWCDVNQNCKVIGIDNLWNLNVQCTRDECNNCAIAEFWYINMTTPEDDSKTVLKCEECEFPDEHENSDLEEVDDDKVSARYRCKDDFIYLDRCPQATCDWEAIDKTIDFHGSCVENTCPFDVGLDNSERIREDVHPNYLREHRYEHGCGEPAAEYVCKDGFSSAQLHQIFGFCRDRGGDSLIVEFDDDACLPKCEFADEMNNANKVEEWRDENYGGIHGATYQCKDDFYVKKDDREDEIRYSERGDEPYAYCAVQEDAAGEKKFSAVYPECREADSCEFPQDLNGGYKVNEDEYDGMKFAYYRCPDHMVQEGSTEVGCSSEDPSQVSDEVSFLCYEGPRCDYPWEIDIGGVDYTSDGAYWYRCYSWGYHLQGDARARCENGRPVVPECVPDNDCGLPEEVEGGWVKKREPNKYGYQCNYDGGYKMSDQLAAVGGYVRCNDDMSMSVSGDICIPFTCEFSPEIANGVKVDASTDAQLPHFMAEYQCDDQFRPEQGNIAYCREDGGIDYPRCISAGTRCNFEEIRPYIQNAELVDVTDFSAAVECNENYRLGDPDSNMLYCDEAGNVFRDNLPSCEKYMPCEFPDEIDGGYLEESYSDTGALYQCYSTHYMASSDLARCNTETGMMDEFPKCEPHYKDDDDDDDDDEEDHDTNYWDGGCDYPDIIAGGYKVFQDEEGDDPWALYACYRGFAMYPNKNILQYHMENSDNDFSESFSMSQGYASCNREHEWKGFPRCVDVRKAHNCGLPALSLEHGIKGVEFGMFEKKDDKENYEDGYGKKMYGDEDEEGDEKDRGMMPQYARYECLDDDLVMMDTFKGNMGWCRWDWDNSMELPRCVHADDFQKPGFRLHPGSVKKLSKDGRIRGGIVLVEWVDRSGGDGDWAMGCDDQFNDNAASSICKDIGFVCGKKIPVNKKMFVGLEEDYMHFAWTNVHCRYPDAHFTGDNCKAMRYEEALEKMGAKATCFGFDTVAIECYDRPSPFTVEMEVVIPKRKNKIICGAVAYKEGNLINMEEHGVSVSVEIDDVELAIGEGEMKYKKKKGFFINKSLKDFDFECVTCSLSIEDPESGDLIEFASASSCDEKKGEE